MWRPTNWSSSTLNSPAASPPPASRNPNDRSYTPSLLGGRAGNNRLRPPLAHRSSTLSLAESSRNVSTTSLPGAVKLQQGMGFRKAVSLPPPPGVLEPLDVLGSILGTVGDVGAEEADGAADEYVGDGEGIDFGGLSLEEFARGEETKVEETGPDGQAQARSSEEYQQEKDNLQDLHRSIKACDEVLKSVESYLSAFQNDLGAVSAEIETLQTRSTALNARLENRKAVEKLLAPVLEDVVIPPNEVRQIVEGEVNEQWVVALQQVDRRIKAIEKQDLSKIKAAQEVKPELEKISDKAIERVRDFFVARIKALRIPGANAQAIQQGGFLRFKELLRFMAGHNEQLADEIAQAYINTMRWYYLTHFQRYQKTLEKLKLHYVDKSNTLGQEEPLKKTNLIPSLKSSPLPSIDPLNIGRRIEILRNRTAPPIPAYQAADDTTVHHLEYPFRHFHTALLENAAAEYSFLTDFFAFSLKRVDAMFSTIFAPTFDVATAFTRALLDATGHDALGILMCVRINQDAAFEMQKRRVPAADGYINGTNMLLWPRLQIVMDLHCESLRKAAVKTAESPAPHSLTQRFATFVHGILTLSVEAGDDEPVANSLSRLTSEFEAVMTRISKGLPDQKRNRFLFNNYSLVLTILSDTEGTLAAGQRAHFEELMKAFRE